MRKTIRKALRAGCVLALSSMLLCSCGVPALSTPILSDAAAQEIESSGRMNAARKTTGALEKETNGTSSTPAEHISAVSAVDVMCHPCGVAVMDDGAMLVTDVYNRVVWRVAEGSSTVYAGVYSADDSDTQPPGGYNDASYEESTFRSPWAIAPFLDGWAVSDPENHVVRLLQDGVVRTINAREAGVSAAASSGAVFEHPTGLAADEDGNLYVADTFADTIYRITPEGEIRTEVAGVSEPVGLCWQDGVLYVAESGKNRVVSVKDGRISVLAGSGDTGTSDGPAEEAAFSSPQGVAVGDDGTVYVADTDNSAIREIRDGQVSTLYARDVRDLQAFFPVAPSGMLNVEDKLYVCDPFARTLLLLAV